MDRVKRSDFIEIDEGVSRGLSSGGPVAFMPNNWFESLLFEDYSINVCGVLTDGRKVLVSIQGVPIYFDAEIPEGQTADKFRAKFSVECSGTTVVSLFPSYKFSPTPTEWMRFSFLNLGDRKRALAQFRKERTANDDEKYFWAVLRSYNIPTADWISLDKFSYRDGKIIIDISGVRKLHKDEKKQMGKVADQDKTLVCSWDIETHFESPNGGVPRVNDSGWTIDVICMSMFWHYQSEPLTEICITMHEYIEDPAKPIPIVIPCRTQREVIISFISVLEGMQPDMLIAFNGACFDSPLVVKLIKDYGLLGRLSEALSFGRKSRPENVEKYNFHVGKLIKINAERSERADLLFNFPSVIDTDAMIVMAQAHPKAEIPRKAGLNFYLEKNNLGGKEDMDYKLMAKVFARSKSLAGAPRQCHCSERCGVCAEDIKILEDDISRCCNCAKRKKAAEYMWLVMYYCKIDCLRPFQLYKKRGVIADRREMANLARVPLSAAFYQADGVKVQNLLGKYAVKCFGIAFSNRHVDKSDDQKDHNKGAFVPYPKLGLHRVVPICGLDAASLYPSLIMDGNYTPDMIIKDPASAKNYAELGYRLREIGPIHYTRGAKKDTGADLSATAWYVWHGGNDEKITVGYTKTYPDGSSVNVIPSPQNLTALGVPDPVFKAERMPVPPAAYPKRAQYSPIYGRARLPNERMGLLPYVCKKLFDKRVPIKALWGKLVEIEKEMTAHKETHREIDGVRYSLEEISYMAAKTNSKQLAIKVLNNTIYGQSGNFRSPSYEFMVAAAITHSGQSTIKAVMDYTRETGGIVWYGDTDSEYVSGDLALFLPAYKQYAEKLSSLGYSSNESSDLWKFMKSWAEVRLEPQHVPIRIELWTEMVKITQQYAERMCEEIGDLMLIINGSRRLSFAFEEVGMPTVFCGKKKYAMIPHEKNINFYPPKVLVAAGNGIMVRGLDMIKQGVPSFAKILGTSVLYESLSPECNDDLRTVVVRYLLESLRSDLSPDEVAKTARYKPEKNNTAVKKFVSRMQERQRTADPQIAHLFEPPEAGDKFSYVVVKNSADIGLNGRVIKDDVGSKMEYLHVFKASASWPVPFVLDKKYYYDAVISMFSRFILYHEDFAPRGGEDYDAYASKQASKYLLGIADEYFGGGKAARGEQLRKYKQIYKESNQLISSHLEKTSPLLARSFTPSSTFAEFIGNLRAEISAGLFSAEKSAEIIIEHELLHGTRQSCVYKYRGAYGPRRGHMNAKLAMRKRIDGELMSYAHRFSVVLSDYSTWLEKITLAKRRGEEISDELPNGLEEIYETIHRFVVISEMIGRQLATHDVIAEKLAPPKPQLSGTARISFSEEY